MPEPIDTAATRADIESRAPGDIVPDDVLVVLDALQAARAELDAIRRSDMRMLDAAHDRAQAAEAESAQHRAAHKLAWDRAEAAEARVAAVLALCDTRDAEVRDLYSCGPYGGGSRAIESAVTSGRVAQVSTFDVRAALGATL